MLQGISYPAHVGLPLGERGARYVVMETHYDNPLLKAGITLIIYIL